MSGSLYDSMIYLGLVYLAEVKVLNEVTDLTSLSKDIFVEWSRRGQSHIV